MVTLIVVIIALQYIIIWSDYVSTKNTDSVNQFWFITKNTFKILLIPFGLYFVIFLRIYDYFAKQFKKDFKNFIDDLPE